MPIATPLLSLAFHAAVIAGHLLIVREAISRCFRISMPWLLWVFVCGVLVSATFLVPWALLADVRLDWPHAPVGWIAYGGACAAVLALSVATRLRPRKPAALLAEQACTMDVAERLGAPRVGTGSRAWVARTPRNDLFRVEVAERQIAIPGLPRELDGLSVLHLTDLHFNGTPGLPFFEHAIDLANSLRPDVVALTGDVLDRFAMAAWLPSTLRRLDAPLGRYFVLGNHDAYDQPAAIRAALCDLGWTDVGGRAVTMPARGNDVLIAGSELPWLGTDPSLPPATENAHGLRLLLAHTPERFAWAQSRAFHLVLAGHLHGGQIDLPLIGPLSGGRYHAGVFRSGATVMHVSRGLGAVFPLRWNCPAELTKLVLRSNGRVAGASAPPRVKNGSCHSEGSGSDLRNLGSE